MKTDCSLRTGEGWSMPPAFALIGLNLLLFRNINFLNWRVSGCYSYYYFWEVFK